MTKSELKEIIKECMIEELIMESNIFNLNSLKSTCDIVEDKIENDKICSILVKELKNNFINSYNKIYKKFESVRNDNYLANIKINNPNDFIKYIDVYSLEFGEAKIAWEDGTKYYAIFQFFIFKNEYMKLSEEDRKNNRSIPITLEAGIDEKYKLSLKDESKILNFSIDG